MDSANPEKLMKRFVGDGGRVGVFFLGVLDERFFMKLLSAAAIKVVDSKYSR